MIKIPKTTFNRKYLAVAVVLLLAVLVGSGVKMYLKPKVVAEDIPVVKTMVISGTEALPSFSYSGEVRGRYESQLAFQVGGKIIRRNVDLGSIVKPGDVLMQIDPKDLQQVVKSGAAQVYSSESQLRLAEMNLRRYEHLYKQGAVSRAQYDQYQTGYDAAVAAARQASAQYTQGSNQLEYSQLYSDISGVVAAINAEVGQVVGAGQTMVTIVRDGEREIEINIPESRLDEIRRAQQIKVKFWALPQTSVDGSVREVAPMADKALRTYKVRISLKNPPPEIKLGMTASVEITASEEKQQLVQYIPLAAVYQNGQSPMVWVVTDRSVKLRPVRLGELGDGKVQVLDGVAAGETIVTAGVHKLRDGQTVNLAGGSL